MYDARGFEPIAVRQQDTVVRRSVAPHVPQASELKN
jgi:hypothetical protein